MSSKINVSARPRKEDDGPRYRRCAQSVWSSWLRDLTVWPGLVLDKPPFRLSVVVPVAGHNLNADRPFTCSGKRVDGTLGDDVPYLNLVCFYGQD